LEAQLRDLDICQVGAGRGVDIDAIIVSGAVGVEKPNRRIFDMALDALDAQPSEALHVGDSVRFDVEGAIAAGISAIHFDPYSLCRANDHKHVASLDQVTEAVFAPD
jgi:putative hydrolase of the HAD superfamily